MHRFDYYLRLHFNQVLTDKTFDGLHETRLSEYVSNILTFLNREDNHHLWIEFVNQKDSQFKFNTTHAKKLVNV